MTKRKNQKNKKVVPQKPRNKIDERKQQRKDKRKGLKQRKLEHHLKRHGKPVPEVIKDDQVQDQAKQIKNEEKRAQREKQKKDKAEKLAKIQKKQRKKLMIIENQEEDKRIKKLEKQLHLNKRKSKSLPASFKEDGLDYLLQACDSEGLKGLEDDSDLEELNESGSESDNESGSSGSNDSGQELLAEDDNGSDADMDQNDEQLETDEEGENEDEMSGQEEDEVEENDEQDSEDDLNKKETNDDSSDDKNVWEDIYGRTRDAKGNVVTATAAKYVPPAMRAALEANKGAADAAALAKLSKQIKGSLNRLAESNLHMITRQMEDLYMSNSRNLMNECLCQILTSSLVSHTLTPERLIMEHALLISILHANVGTEVGANVLQTMVSKYLELYNNTDNLENIESKMLDNYLQIVSHMYAFQIVGHDILFDLLDNLSNSFQAKDVELILLVLKAVGFMLRKDDPAKLKYFILKVQRKSNEKDTSAGQSQSLSRVQFMLEVLLAIKNNNVKKIPNYDPSHQAHLQKITKNFLRPGCSVTPLKVSLEDLTNADTRGRWWIVGSAWTGKGTAKSEVQVQNSSETKFSAKLLTMAKKMRMNTEARKNLFCALMSADDYMDAFERLVKVDKASISANTRERDTAFVIMACSLKEPTFNPFYSQLAIKLGSFDRKYRMAVQCCIWDRIRDIENLKKNQQNQLAMFTSHLIKERLLSLACLKVIEFSELNKTLVRFVKRILLELLNEPDTKQMIAPFVAVAGYPKLSVFRDGLRLFLRHFLLRSAEKEGLDKVDLKKKIEQAESAISAGDKRLLL